MLQVNRFKKEEIEKADYIEQTSYEVTIPYNKIFYISSSFYIKILALSFSNLSFLVDRTF